MRVAGVKGRRAVGQHSSASFEWGSGVDIIERGREVLGEFDVDPASSAHWNQYVRARRFITRQEDGRKTPWVPGAPAPNKLIAQRRLARPRRYTAWVNSPNEDDGELLAFYWRALSGYYELGWISSAIWVGFSVEQLSRLQRVGAASDPLEHVTAVPCKRLHYKNRRGPKKSQPGHASYITLLTHSRAEVERFCARFGELGRVTRGDRWR